MANDEVGCHIKYSPLKNPPSPMMWPFLKLLYAILILLADAASLHDYSRSDAKRPLIEQIIVNIWRIIDNESCLDWATKFHRILHDPRIVALFIAEQ